MYGKNFVHLHVHSEYSLLDGTCRLDDLVSAAKTYAMPSLAITDHGNMFGAIEFYRKAKDAGIKPILGIEAYVAPKSRFDKTPKETKETLYHLTLLVENSEGYQNLLKLTSAAYLEGFYRKPRVDKELLNNNSKGIICLSGCMKSEVNLHIINRQHKEAVKAASEYKEIFGRDNFFLELQDNNIEDQKILINEARKIAEKLLIPVVATNDIHYMRPEDSIAHEILLCINTQKQLKDEDRMRFGSNEFYFKTPEEMLRLFGHIPEAITNTTRIADRCNINLEFGRLHLPRFYPDKGSEIYQQGMTNAQFLRRLCEIKALERYKGLNSTIKERLDHELKVIEDTGFVDYFLIVWDFINFAVKNRIPATGRGSGAGSLVAYVLGITNIDPIENDLLFERFLNAERINMPDLDIDFCAEGRERVIQYVKEKYGGGNNVAQIITFGTMKARAVIRDAGRVMGVPLSEINAISKLIPPTLGITLKEALEQEPQLKSLYKEKPHIKELFDISSRLEGLCRHTSVHAAGIVISDEPIIKYVPLAKNRDIVVTQFDDATLVEHIGLLKADFLGVRKLTVIDKTIKLIKETKGCEIDISKIPMDDKRAFDLLSRGDVKGIFQVETSRGIKELLIKLKPERFADILPLIALYRPGPLQSGMVDNFINCRHGRQKVTYLHPSLEPILKETYGIILYQEQVMLIANKLAGFTLNEADNLRKAMGKKKPEVMAKFKNKFIDGAINNSIPRPIVEKIFELMEYFAGYGFNKSHSAAYAVITYQTAYLKANYPTQYMTSQMSCEKENTEKIVGYLEECRRLGIEVLPPCINESNADFTMIREGKIRFGLGAIKNVGEKAIESLINARSKGKFASIYDFCKRVDLRLVNKQVMESLIKSGALDSFPGHRAQFLHGLDNVLQFTNMANQDRCKRQMTFFNIQDETAQLLANQDQLPEVERWSEAEILRLEKETIGFYISSHPLEKYKDIIKSYSRTSTSTLSEHTEGDDVLICGIITELKNTTTKKGEQMAYVSIEDFEGMAVCVMFNDELVKYNKLIKLNEVVFIKGYLGFRNAIPSIRVKEVISVADAHGRLTEWRENRMQGAGGRRQETGDRRQKIGDRGNGLNGLNGFGAERQPLSCRQSLTIKLDRALANEDIFLKLQKILSANKGQCPVFLELTTPEMTKVRIEAGAGLCVELTDRLCSEVEGILGPGHISIEEVSEEVPKVS